jgi:GNAT superfamily N-acetyltransferase
VSIGAIAAIPIGAEFRVATRRDLPAAARIHAAGDLDQTRRMHPLSGVAPFDKAARTQSALAGLERQHEENPRQVWIAAQEGRVIGLASAAFRDRHAHVQSFFVSPRMQQRGIGGELLRRLFRAAEEVGCSRFSLQASDDPRALGLYFRLGLLVQAPNVVWAATRPAFPRPRFDSPFEQSPLDAADEATLNTASDIDKAVRGAHRKQDLTHWLQEPTFGRLLLDRETGKPAGYFIISPAGPIGQIGPVASMDVSRFGDVFHSALAAAGEHHSPGQIWRLSVPGENFAVVDPLIASRFRPAFLMPFLASEPIGRFDRYVFHDLDYL